jgi:hypothetical protein
MQAQGKVEVLFQKSLQLHEIFAGPYTVRLARESIVHGGRRNQMRSDQEFAKSLMANPGGGVNGIIVLHLAPRQMRIPAARGSEPPDRA